MTTKYLVSTCYAGFSTKEDLAHAEKFFEGKDVSKYNMALAQAYDSIKAKIRWIEVSLSCFRCVIQIVVKKLTMALAAVYGRSPELPQRVGERCCCEVVRSDDVFAVCSGSDVANKNQVYCSQ